MSAQQKVVAKSFEHSAIDPILKDALSADVTDIHLKAGHPPMFRINGKVQTAAHPPLSSSDIIRFLDELLTEKQRSAFAQARSINVSYSFDTNTRFRCNISLAMGSELIIMRRIPNEIPSFEDLRLPEVLKAVIGQKNGLILVTGKAGSGKSTTLAALAEHINTTQNKHIVSIEDPIEYHLVSKSSMITQKELGSDVVDYPSAAKEVLRQDPDIIIIGEIRDPVTASFALNAAETGHLVISTLHSVDALETINRLTSFFESHQHLQIRSQLSTVLRAVLCQKLLPRADGSGLIPAFEIMIPNERIKKMILMPETTRDILEAIEEGQVNYEMQSFDQSLVNLHKDGLITFAAAKENATRPTHFDLHKQGVSSLDLMKWSGDSVPEMQQLEVHAPLTTKTPNLNEFNPTKYFRKKKTKRPPTLIESVLSNYIPAYILLAFGLAYFFFKIF